MKKNNLKMGDCTDTKCFIRILCFSLFLSTTNQYRKYDIEAESLKIYKEDLGTVLLRFRRSPEYIKILEEKSAEFDVYVSDVKNQITFFYLDQLEKKIAEMLGINMDKNEEEPSEVSGGSKRSGASGASGILLKSGRRTDDPDNITAAERLDSYSKLSSSMSLKQRNFMRDLGFQYAGHIIHALIKNMGPDRVDGKSTKYVGETTTEHVSIHSVPLLNEEEMTQLTTPEEPHTQMAGGEGEKTAPKQKRYKVQ